MCEALAATSTTVASLAVAPAISVHDKPGSSNLEAGMMGRGAAMGLMGQKSEIPGTNS